jgi:hypothetical protein
VLITEGIFTPHEAPLPAAIFQYATMERPLRQDFELIFDTIFCTPPKVRALKISSVISIVSTPPQNYPSSQISK